VRKNRTYVVVYNERVIAMKEREIVIGSGPLKGCVCIPGNAFVKICK
jgi:hypothetical protein